MHKAKEIQPFFRKTLGIMMKDDKAFALLAEAIIAFYKAKQNNAEAFESYAYGQRLRLAISPSLFRARFLRGYKILSTAQRKNKK